MRTVGTALLRFGVVAVVIYAMIMAIGPLIGRIGLDLTKSNDQRLAEEAATAEYRLSEKRRQP